MRKYFIYCFLSFLLCSACNWLDVVPEEDMKTVDSDFETRDNAEDWLRSVYVLLQKFYTPCQNVALVGADELVADLSSWDNSISLKPGLRIAAGMQNVLDPYDDMWLDMEHLDNYRDDFYTGIVLCNTFITHIDKVYNLDNVRKREWKAEVKALKALFYFEMVRRYGPVIIVPEELDPNADIETLKYPRSHVDTCFNLIVRLCDEAAADLPIYAEKESARRYYFNKEAALALKARALCYQASDLFNGNTDYASFKNKNGEPLFSAERDEAKWRRAADAAIEAISVCAQSGKQLIQNVTGTPQPVTTDLQRRMLDLEYSVRTMNGTSAEALLITKVQTYSDASLSLYTIPLVLSDPYQMQPGACLAPSVKMARMFYTANGLPIDEDPKWCGAANPYGMSEETDPAYVGVVALNTPMLSLHREREPRFYASIGADRCYWRLGTKADENYLVEAWQGEEFGLKSQSFNVNTPQNITGYWMKKWSQSETSLYGYNVSESTYPIFRMAELYLIAAEALNECEGPVAAYEYLNVVRRRAGIPDVEESWKNARNPGKVSDKKGMRSIIHQEWNIEYAFENTRFWNLRRWKEANIDLNEKSLGWNVLGKTADAFYNGGKGPVVVSTRNKFVAPRDYFWPIRSEEVQTAGCVQNPGW